MHNHLQNYFLWLTNLADRYIGKFQGDKMHSESTQIYATGRVYTGLFKGRNLLRKRDATPNQN